MAISRWQYPNWFRPPPFMFLPPPTIADWNRPTNPVPDDEYTDTPVLQGGHEFGPPWWNFIDAKTISDWNRPTNPTPDDVEYPVNQGGMAPAPSPQVELPIATVSDWNRPTNLPPDDVLWQVFEGGRDFSIPWVPTLSDYPDFISDQQHIPDIEDSGFGSGSYTTEPTLYVAQNLDWLRQTNMPPGDIEPIVLEGGEARKQIDEDDFGSIAVPNMGWLSDTNQPPDDTEPIVLEGGEARRQIDESDFGIPVPDMDWLPRTSVPVADLEAGFHASFFAPDPAGLQFPTYVSIGAPFLYVEDRFDQARTTELGAYFGVKFHVQAYMRAVAGTVYLRLYDVTDAVPVGNSDVSTAGTSLAILQSSAFDLADGHEYVSQFGTTATSSGEYQAAYIHAY